MSSMRDTAFKVYSTTEIKDELDGVERDNEAGNNSHKVHKSSHSNMSAKSVIDEQKYSEEEDLNKKEKSQNASSMHKNTNSNGSIIFNNSNSNEIINASKENQNGNNGNYPKLREVHKYNKRSNSYIITEHFYINNQLEHRIKKRNNSQLQGNSYLGLVASHMDMEESNNSKDNLDRETSVRLYTTGNEYSSDVYANEEYHEEIKNESLRTGMGHKGLEEARIKRIDKGIENSQLDSLNLREREDRASEEGESNKVVEKIENASFVGGLEGDEEDFEEDEIRFGGDINYQNDSVNHENVVQCVEDDFAELDSAEDQDQDRVRKEVINNSVIEDEDKKRIAHEELQEDYIEEDRKSFLDENLEQVNESLPRVNLKMKECKIQPAAVIDMNEELETLNIKKEALDSLEKIEEKQEATKEENLSFVSLEKGLSSNLASPDNSPEKINSVNNSQTNSPDYKKPANLLNSIQIMYDQNTERSKKRSEQMKKMREKLKTEGRSRDLNVNQLNFEGELDSSQSRNKKNLLPSKRFYEKVEDKVSVLESAINSIISEPKTKNLDLDDDRVVFISDPEPDIEDENTDSQQHHHELNMVQNYPNKSNTFLAIHNNLSIKTNILKNEGNVTSSYLMALNQCASSPTAEETTKKQEEDSKGSSSVQCEYDSNNNIKNYVLNEIVEEDPSECTDSEIGSKKKSLLQSGFLTKDSKLLKQLSFTSGYLEEKSKEVLLSPVSSTKNRNLNHFTFNSLNRHSLSAFNLSKSQKEKIIKLTNHKTSKSDVVDAKLEIIKFMENLEKRIKLINAQADASLQKKTNLKKRILRELLKVKASSCHNLESLKIELSDSEGEKEGKGINTDRNTEQEGLKQLDLSSPKTTTKIKEPNTTKNIEIKIQDESSPVSFKNEEIEKNAFDKRFANYSKVKKNDSEFTNILQFDSIEKDNIFEEDEDSIEEKEPGNTQNTIRKIEFNDDVNDEGANLEDIIMNSNKNIHRSGYASKENRQEDRQEEIEVTPRGEICFNSEEDYDSNCFYSPVNTQVYLKSENSEKLKSRHQEKQTLWKHNSKPGQVKTKESLELFKKNLLLKCEKEASNSLQVIRDKYKSLRKQASSYRSEAKPSPGVLGLGLNENSHHSKGQDLSSRLQIKNFNSNIIKCYNISMFDKITNDEDKLILDHTYSSRTSGSGFASVKNSSNSRLQRANANVNPKAKATNNEHNKKKHSNIVPSNEISTAFKNNFLSYDLNPHIENPYQSPVKKETKHSSLKYIGEFEKASGKNIVINSEPSMENQESSSQQPGKKNKGTTQDYNTNVFARITKDIANFKNISKSQSNFFGKEVKKHYKTPSLNLNNKVLSVINLSIQPNSSKNLISVHSRSNSTSKNLIEVTNYLSSNSEVEKASSKSKFFISSAYNSAQQQTQQNTHSSNALNSYNTAPSNSELFKSNDLKHLMYTTVQKNFESEKKRYGKIASATSSNCNATSSCPRVSSESSISTFQQGQPVFCFASASTSNRDQILEAMKYIRFQKSSLDHQKYSYEKIYKSKSRNFCILLAHDKKKSPEFKALYEMNEEKNQLFKLYAINNHPSYIDYNEMIKPYYFDSESKSFKNLGEQQCFNSSIHGVSILLKSSSSFKKI